MAKGNKELSFKYDKESDVLYVRMGKKTKAISVEVDDGILLRVDPKTDEVVGLTILYLSKRTKGSEEEVKVNGLDCTFETHKIAAQSLATV